MKWLRGFFGVIVAIVILFEEWGWEPLQALMARIGRLPPLAWLERRVARLPSYAALAVLAVPALAILPVKLAAVWFMARGHALGGLIVIVVAKLAGTAVLARLFALTQPALMRLAWFARWYTRWVAWKNELKAWVRASWAWRHAADIKRWLLARWRRASRGG
jgi:hypothetical protein